MRINILMVSIMLLTNINYAQTSFYEIDNEIELGNYKIAKSMILDKISDQKITEIEKYNLKMQSDILDRRIIDFNRDETYIKNALSTYYPKLTDSQLSEWETSGELEMLIIDGKKKYFRNAVPNLFRIYKEANKIKIQIDGVKKDSLSLFLQKYLPIVVDEIKSDGHSIAHPQKFEFTYTLTVKPNIVPDGEIIRAWLPYPRSDIKRQNNVQFKSASESTYVISPDKNVHKSIYFEKVSNKDEPTIFEYQVSYTGYNQWHNIDNLKIKPYNKNSVLYKTYTSERERHVLFTPEIENLSKEILGPKKDPKKIVRLFYEWIGENIPWASALEYSTIPNIPSYSINNMKGDCGIKALLFITLCRYNGIPAKWQSGWMLHPGNKNLHDWAEVYFEGVGWIPVDTSFNNQDISEKSAKEFFLSGIDAYHMIVNEDFSGEFFPAKTHQRSETVDFQRGEVEWKGGNLYFNNWNYHMEVEHLD